MCMTLRSSAHIATSFAAMPIAPEPAICVSKTTSAYVPFGRAEQGSSGDVRCARSVRRARFPDRHMWRRLNGCDRSGSPPGLSAPRTWTTPAGPGSQPNQPATEASLLALAVVGDAPSERSGPELSAQPGHWRPLRPRAARFRLPPDGFSEQEAETAYCQSRSQGVRPGCLV